MSTKYHECIHEYLLYIENGDIMARPSHVMDTVSQKN